MNKIQQQIKIKIKMILGFLGFIPCLKSIYLDFEK